MDGLAPLTPEKLTHQHIEFMKSACGEFAQSIAAKDFLLMAAPHNRAFYLSDNPVNLHNSEPTDGFWGNMGLECTGIEIYVPLSSKLVLAAWCPSILAKIRARRAEQRLPLATTILSPALLRGGRNSELSDQLS